METAMICPQCKYPQQMQKYQSDHLTISRCGQCCGLWFSESQLNMLSKAVDPDTRSLEVGFWKERVAFRVTHDPMRCPYCRDTYLVRVYDETSDTAVATCPLCQGIWFERGQLDRIITLLSEEVERRGSGDYLKQSLRLLADLVAGHQNKAGGNWHDFRTVLQLLKYRLYSEHPRLVRTLLETQNSLPI